jgi:CheY-like chemotaxis protein
MSSSHATSATLRGARLLLIEDDESLREVLTMNLEDLGLNVTPCESAERALERFREAQHRAPMSSCSPTSSCLSGRGLSCSASSRRSMRPCP